jgi:group II intron reverse transcriptase/maturase
MPELAFTSLNHYIDKEWMTEAYRRTRKSGAPGVDGQTAREYAEDLGEKLRDLLERAKSGRYYAPPVKRVHIPKRGKENEQRPIGIPTFEDKILQRAVVMVLEPIYEHDFLECSYGFRPRRSAHDALKAIWQHIMSMKQGCWILEADISKFFDTLDKSQLRKFLDHRVRDGVIRRLIDKWLKAGVMTGEGREYPEKGSPQGGVISPLLSNVYLHEVLDVWYEQDVRPRMKGRSFLVRYADDFLLGFEEETDARRVMKVLAKRFEKYGLTIHPDKTKLFDFGRPKGGQKKGRGTFDLLGFRHYWGRSRKGNWVVKRKTASKRLSLSLQEISKWCRINRHRPVEDQCRTLSQKLTGHYQYFGFPENKSSLQYFLYEVRHYWRKWLSRRTRGKRMSWNRFEQLERQNPLPLPRLDYSLYASRSEATT